MIHNTVFAQRANTGITVSPALVQLDLATDKPQATLTYTNNTTQPVTITFAASNVNELEDSYSVTLLQPKDVQNYHYGLSSWIEFSNTSLVLEPKQTDLETLFVNAKELSPGGHYGSVLAQIQQGNPSSTVIVKGVLATPIFVRAHTGKEFEKGSITTFSPEQNFWDFPTNFLLRFTNTGDTYVIPYGKVTITDFLGNGVAEGILNQGSLMVLPQTLRRYEIPVESGRAILWPGVYHASLIMHFGKNNQIRSATTTFFSFGTLPILPALVIILIGLNIYLFWRKSRSAK